MTPADLSTGRGIKRCRNGHAMTKKNTVVRCTRGREYNGCLTCQRLAKLRWKRRQGSQPRIPKIEAQRELYRTKVYASPDSPYRTAMIEAFALYDAWLATDKRPQRFGRKYPQQKRKAA